MSTTQPARLDRPGRDDILAVVREAVATVLERDPAEVGRHTAFTDLHADSLALVEVAEIVEERLAPFAPPGFRIPDEDLERLRTVGDTVDYVASRL